MVQRKIGVHTRRLTSKPENDGLEDDFPFPGGPYSQVPCASSRVYLTFQMSCQFPLGISIMGDPIMGDPE